VLFYEEVRPEDDALSPELRFRGEVKRCQKLMTTDYTSRDGGRRTFGGHSRVNSDLKGGGTQNLNGGRNQPQPPQNPPPQNFYLLPYSGSSGKRKKGGKKGTRGPTETIESSYSW